MGALVQYCLAERVAQTHKVILTGHGGDELFSGYPVFKLVRILQNLKQNPPVYSGQPQSAILRDSPPSLFFSRRHEIASIPSVFPVLNSASSLRQGLNPSGLMRLRTCLLRMNWSLWTRPTNKMQTLHSHYLQAYLNNKFAVEDKLSMHTH